MLVRVVRVRGGGGNWPHIHTQTAPVLERFVVDREIFVVSFPLGC